MEHSTETTRVPDFPHRAILAAMVNSFSVEAVNRSTVGVRRTALSGTPEARVRRLKPPSVVLSSSLSANWCLKVRSFGCGLV